MGVDRVILSKVREQVRVPLTFWHVRSGEEFHHRGSDTLDFLVCLRGPTHIRDALVELVMAVAIIGVMRLLRLCRGLWRGWGLRGVFGARCWCEHGTPGE